MSVIIEQPGPAGHQALALCWLLVVLPSWLASLANDTVRCQAVTVHVHVTTRQLQGIVGESYPLGYSVPATLLGTCILCQLRGW
jgi:hypothetical protein